MSRNSLTIRLTESVVFLRTADRTSRHYVVPIDSPPSMVRGLLTLYLAKPTRISSIELELQGKNTNAWSEGVGGRRVEIMEENKIFTASTVFFNASSAQSSRRTASLGPGILRDAEALEEWDYDHQAVSAHRTEDSTSPNANTSPPRRVRRVSADNSTFQRDYITHLEDQPLSPPYVASAPPTASVSHIEQTPAQSLEEFRNVLRADLGSIDIPHPTSIPPPPTSRPGSLSPHSPPNSLRLSRSTSKDDALYRDNSPSASRSPIPSRSRDRLSRVPTRDATPPMEKSPEQRGRHTSRFSFAGISNAILGAVKGERARSNSPRAPSPIGGITRGRTVKKDTVAAATPPATHRSTLGKFNIGELLGLDGDEDRKTSGDGWKEFKKGTYTYPISFTIPANSPPSLQCDFGNVVWRLKANVHRPGAFTPKLTAVRDVTVISCPGEDDMDEHECLIVERQWEGQLRYLIAISGRMFYVGGTIPMQITFMPMAKVKIHRVAIFLEERVDYYVQMKRIGRTDPIHRSELLFLKPVKKDSTSPILPLDPDDPNAFRNSPLYSMCTSPDGVDEMASELMGPGPWTFHTDLQLPTCARLKFTNKNQKSNIMVGHMLKFVLRVERGGEAADAVDPRTGKRRLFDIIVQTPVQILSCRCNPEWTSLPGYSESFEDASARSQSCPCTTRLRHTVASPKDTPEVSSKQARTANIPFPSVTQQQSTLSRITSRASTAAHEYLVHPVFEPPPSVDSTAANASAAAGPSSATTSAVNGTTNNSHHSHHHPHHHLSIPEADSPRYQNELFERLVSGQESEIGEAPPAYASVAASVQPIVG